jgi:hypothetical protein
VKLFWGIDRTVEVASQDEFSSLLDKLADEARARGMIVQAIHNNGRTLAIGVGREVSVLTFFDGLGHSFTSVGNRQREDYLNFDFGGEVSELMGAKAVPIALARSAAKEFFDTGSRPGCLEWEREWA